MRMKSQSIVILTPNDQIMRVKNESKIFFPEFTKCDDVLINLYNFDISLFSILRYAITYLC